MSAADKLAKLREAATPGPWGFSSLSGESGYVISVGGDHIGCEIVRANMDRHQDGGSDAALIVQLVNATPQLIAALEVVDSVSHEGCEFRRGDEDCPERWPGHPRGWCDPCSARAARADLDRALGRWGVSRLHAMRRYRKGTLLCPACHKPVYWPQEGTPRDAEIYHVLCAPPKRPYPPETP